MNLTVTRKTVNCRDVIVIDFHFPDGSTIHYERPPIDWFPLLMALLVAVSLGFFGWMFYILR